MRNCPARTFQDLQVWQHGHAFVLEIYRMTASFPKSETYGLAVQARRAATSIPANIAEGFKKAGPTGQSPIHEHSPRINRRKPLLPHSGERPGLLRSCGCIRLPRENQPPPRRVYEGDPPRFIRSKQF